MDDLKNLVDDFSYTIPVEDGFDYSDRKDLQNDLMEFAKKVIAIERERCAKIAEAYPTTRFGHSASPNTRLLCARVAEEIRKV